MEKSLSNLPARTDEDQSANSSYDVGFKKPPVHTRFQKGQSGNRKGRPKGALNKPKDMTSLLLTDLILEEAYRDININDGEKSLTVPIVKAALRSLALNAAKGKHHSQQLFLKLVGEVQEARENQKFQLFEAAIEYKERWEHAIEQAKKFEQPIPDPLPHPEHVVFDPRTGDVRIIGPMSHEEKKEWDLWIARKMRWLEDLEELKQELKDNEIPEHARFIQDDIDHITRLLNITRQRFPDDIYIPPSTVEFIKSKPDLTFPEMKEKAAALFNKED